MDQCPPFGCGLIFLCRLFFFFFLRTHASTTRMKTKDRPGGPLVSRKMGDDFLVEVKLIHTRWGVESSVSGPTEYSIGNEQHSQYAHSWPLLSSHLPGAGLSSMGLESVGRAGCGHHSVDLENRVTFLITSEKQLRNTPYWARSSPCLRSLQAVFWDPVKGT